MAGFDVKGKTLPTVTMRLLHAAIIILDQLHEHRGTGDWLGELHDVIIRPVKHQRFEETAFEEEIEQIDAALLAIDALFSTVNPTCRWPRG
jgi:hypothetical protein